MAGRRFRDLPAWMQALISAAAAVEVGLLAAAQIDISRRSADQVRGSKLGWRLVSLINFVGPILYFRRGRVGSGGEPDESGTAPIVDRWPAPATALASMPPRSPDAAGSTPAGTR